MCIPEPIIVIEFIRYFWSRQNISIYGVNECIEILKFTTGYIVIGLQQKLHYKLFSYSLVQAFVGRDATT